MERRPNGKDNDRSGLAARSIHTLALFAETVSLVLGTNSTCF